MGFRDQILAIETFQAIQMNSLTFMLALQFSVTESLLNKLTNIIRFSLVSSGSLKIGVEISTHLSL
jgi:hypothetical protein